MIQVPRHSRKIQLHEAVMALFKRGNKTGPAHVSRSVVGAKQPTRFDKIQHVLALDQPLFEAVQAKLEQLKVLG